MFSRNLQTNNLEVFDKYADFFMRNFCRVLLLKIFLKKNPPIFGDRLTFFLNFTLYIYTELYTPLPCPFHSLYKMHVEYGKTKYF